MNKKYYITTPIYYVNDKPHIGHAYTTIAADVLARYHKARGEDVFFLTGTDEHGAKIAEAAKKAGKEPKVFVDELVPQFKEAWKNLNIDYSEFFRTTNPIHEKSVQDFWQNLNEKGFVEKRKYEGLYCIGCERYYKTEELVEGKCPDHKTAPVKQSEENYFFLLSKLTDRLSQAIEKGELQIGPETRRNEVLSKIKMGLEDVSISRANVEWGIPFPGDPEQTIYVWVDALLNYYTAEKIFNNLKTSQECLVLENEISGLKGDSPRASKGTVPGPAWPADLQLMAKDILWFHAVIWPAMLLAADLPLPRKVFAHGFFTIAGAKMSKTVGNVIDPNDVVAKFGADAVRYALLREFPFGEDGDISVEKIAARYQEDLGNTLGNLLQRTIVMINKYEVSESASQRVSESALRLRLGQASQQINIDAEIEALQFSRALEKIMGFAGDLNQLINEKAPWVLAKEGKNDEVATVLDEVYLGLSQIAEVLLPFMPKTAERMKKQLETLEPEPLFPRISE